MFSEEEEIRIEGKTKIKGSEGKARIEGKRGRGKGRGRSGGQDERSGGRGG